MALLSAAPGERADIALEGPGIAWSRRELDAAASRLAGVLQARGAWVLATLMDNSPAWVVAELAADIAGVVHVPLPPFFTSQQIACALQAAGVDTLLITPQLATPWLQLPRHECTVAGAEFVLLTLPSYAVQMPACTARITFTSGSNGTPRGVCLHEKAMRRAAWGLVSALGPLEIGRHLCVLPLAVLAESLAGVLAPLARGATVVVPPLAEVGLTGASGFDAGVFDAAVRRYAPESLVLLPHMLRAWTGWLQQNAQPAPASLKIAIVAGAAAGERLIRAARERGIPAYEGYGLAEAGALQTLNLPGADVPGSAGRALPHARMRIAADGEIEVGGTLMAGYLGDPAPVPHWWPTGDVGSIDAAGFLHVLGRKSGQLGVGIAAAVSPQAAA